MGAEVAKKRIKRS
uniref:Uncharacterized protein n=1 Tax=Arundo donax TaxID=35708 RepID=A0A0A8YML1_ARUDO